MNLKVLHFFLCRVHKNRLTRTLRSVGDLHLQGTVKIIFVFARDPSLDKLNYNGLVFHFFAMNVKNLRR